MSHSTLGALPFGEEQDEREGGVGGGMSVNARNPVWRRAGQGWPSTQWAHDDGSMWRWEYVAVGT